MGKFCEELGIYTIFSGEADFSPMSSERLKVESITHNAHIEVDRKGTRAAAVSMMGFTKSLYITVHLDRPFIYAIMNTETGLPVFTGIFNHADGEIIDEKDWEQSSLIDYDWRYEQADFNFDNNEMCLGSHLISDIFDEEGKLVRISKD